MFRQAHSLDPCSGWQATFVEPHPERSQRTNFKSQSPNLNFSNKFFDGLEFWILNLEIVWILGFVIWRFFFENSVDCTNGIQKIIMNFTVGNNDTGIVFN